MEQAVADRLILSVAITALFLLCCVLYVLLYRLDKLRYGDDLQLLGHVVIVAKILTALVCVSQLWLSENADYTLMFFLGGVLLLYSLFRSSFTEVRKEEFFLQVSILAALIFGSGACLAVVYYGVHKMRGNDDDDTSVFLHRFVLYGGGSLVCLLVAQSYEAGNNYLKKFPTKQKHT